MRNLIEKQNNVRKDLVFRENKTFSQTLPMDIFVYILLDLCLQQKKQWIKKYTFPKI